MNKQEYGFDEEFGTKCKKCGTCFGGSCMDLFDEDRLEKRNKALITFDNNYCRKCGNKLTVTDDNKPNTEECWVIQRDDGMYYAEDDRWVKFSHLLNERCVIFSKTKNGCDLTIKIDNLQNCHPVKVEIKVVEE